MSKPGIEGRGLLQPEEFDIDDLDYLDPQNGHAGGRDRSRSLSGRRGRWLRPRMVCYGLAAIVALLVAGIALNRGGGFKIPRLHKDPASLPDSSTEPAPPPLPPTKPEEHNLPSKFDPSDTPRLPDDIDSPEVPEASKTPEVPDDSSAHNATTDSALSADSTNTTNSSNATGDISDENLGLYETADGKLKKPTGFKIIGLLFFGRPASVAILNCYLQKNLVRNGGWLDEVHFGVNTDKEDDLKWLDDLVKTTKEYKSVDIGEKGLGRDGYNAMWATVDNESLYIKMDDDILYFDDEAIPNLVFSRLKHPAALAVAANLINCPETGWLHYHFGAIHAYLPELSRPKDGLGDFKAYGPTAWRASALPEWTGDEMSFPIAGFLRGKDNDGGHLHDDVPGAPPYKGHRWLPLPDGDQNLWRTPMAESEYAEDGLNWASWSLAAQEHYSFLQNLENDDLHLYRYGNGKDPRREGIWDMNYERYNINFMAIWGKDVLDNLPFDSFDDEKALSVEVPVKLRRPLIVNTHALAAHFSFRTQLEVYDTDLLDRYRAYANEMVCTKETQVKTS